VALHVIEKARQRHRTTRMATDPPMQTHAHHLRVLRALLPQQYWGPSRVKLDNLIFAINTDASVRVQKLKANTWA